MRVAWIAGLALAAILVAGPAHAAVTIYDHTFLVGGGAGSGTDTFTTSVRYVDVEAALTCGTTAGSITLTAMPIGVPAATAGEFACPGGAGVATTAFSIGTYTVVAGGAGLSSIRIVITGTPD